MRLMTTLGVNALVVEPYSNNEHKKKSDRGPLALWWARRVQLAGKK